jgi:hypothetical protein
MLTTAKIKYKFEVMVPMFIRILVDAIRSKVGD